MRKWVKVGKIRNAVIKLAERAGYCVMVVKKKNISSCPSFSVESFFSSFSLRNGYGCLSLIQIFKIRLLIQVFGNLPDGFVLRKTKLNYIQVKQK